MEGGTFASALRALFALLGVCTLAWVLIPLLARRGVFRFAVGLGRSPARLQVLERVALSPRRHVYLVRADARVFLLGAGEGGAPSLIAELEPEFEPEPLRSRPAEAAN